MVESRAVPAVKLLRRPLPLIALVILLTTTGSVVLSESSDPLAVTNTTLTATADTYVNQAKPTTNYGKSRTLRTDTSPTLLRSYLKFAVTGIGNQSVSQAELRLYPTSKTANGLRVYAVPNTDWSEYAMTFTNSPAFGSLITTSGTLQSGVWLSIDVTSAITADGVISLGLQSASDVQIALASRETGSTAPQLIVTTGQPSPSPTATTSAATSTTSASPTVTSTSATPSPTVSASPTSTSPAQPTFPIRAAFVYPWFPEAWNQQGYNPFTIYTPTAGYYDSSDPATVSRQLDELQYAGMDAGIASWWGQGSQTDGRIPAMLTAASSTSFKWSLYYELEGQGNPDAATLSKDLDYIAGRYASSPAFLRVNNKPVLFVYADASDGCAMVDRWKQANNGRFYVVLKVFSGYQNCTNQPDSWHQYGPAVATSNQAPYSYSVSPGFWKKGESTARLTRDPTRWADNIKSMVASGAGFQLVTTYNEWGEGTSVEPAVEWNSSSGYGTYVDQLHQSLGQGQPPTTSATSSSPSASVSPSPSPTAGTDPIIAAAGDIACDPTSSSYNGGAGTSGSCHMRAVSDLLVSGNYAAVLPLGDTQYECGDLSAFTQSYEPTWGRVKGVTSPVIGNHEYGTGCGRNDPTGYFSYFGTSASRQSGKGWYSFDIGSWHIVVLNSECSYGTGTSYAVGGCNTGSPQESWLKADLAAHPAACTLAAWHEPRFSSGQHGDAQQMADIWNDLVAAKADVVLSGHNHDYERFDPIGATPRDTTSSPSFQVPNLDPNGIREFVVGTGGKNHYAMAVAPYPGEVVTNSDTYGFLTLRLHANSYDWMFVPEPGKTFTDAGSGSCH